MQQVEKHLILRTSWVYGAYGSNFLNTMLRLTGEKELRIVDDQVGCPTSSERIASVLLELAQRYQSDGKLPWGALSLQRSVTLLLVRVCSSHIRSCIQSRNYWTLSAIDAYHNRRISNASQAPCLVRAGLSPFESTFGISPTPWRADLQATLQSLKADSDRLHISSVRC